MNKITLLVACLISTFTFSDTLLHVGNLIDVSSGEISKAVTIRISGNKIENIPVSISRLTKLKYLNVKSNNLSNIPELIGELISLKILYISDNKIRETKFSRISITVV